MKNNTGASNGPEIMLRIYPGTCRTARLPLHSRHLLLAAFCRCVFGITFLIFFRGAVTRAENAVIQWLPPAVLEIRYDVALPVRGGEGTLRWTFEGDLPPGLHFQEGRITGEPEHVGIWQFVATVRDEIDESLQTKFGIRVLPAPAPELRIVSRTLPVAYRKTVYYGALKAEGGYPPYKWSVSAGGLPSWAWLDGNHIRGTPQNPDTIGLNRLQVSVRDAQGNTAGPVSLTLYVKENPLAQPLRIMPSAELAPAVAGMPYRAEIMASGGVPPYRLSVETDCPGLEYKGNGILSGKAVKEGLFSVSVSLSDADGESRESRIRLPVVGPASADMAAGKIQGVSALKGEPFVFSVPVAGGLKPYESALEAALPPGLEWNAETRSISGIPTRPGEWRCHIRITDSAGSIRKVNFPIRIQSPYIDMPGRKPAGEETKRPLDYLTYAVIAAGWAVALCLGALLLAARRRKP